jgi:hypothetical protein
MKKSDLTPGTKVLATWDCPEWEDAKMIKYRHDEYDDYAMVGVVSDKDAPAGKVFVKWEESEADLDPDEDHEVDIKLLTLFSDRAEIEKEYKVLMKELAGKMKEASSIIKEAGKLARKHGYSLADTVGYDLYDAMDSAGWRTSSFGC